MKISKLFHWLYAFLMFLPIVFFVPTCFYYSFNKYATNTTTTEVVYKYESNEVNSINDLVVGNVYFFDIDSALSTEIFTHIDGYISFQLLDTFYLDGHSVSNYDFGYPEYFSPSTYITLENGGNIYIYTSLEEFNEGNYIVMFNYYRAFANGINIQLLRYDEIDYEYLTYTDFNVIDYINENVDDTITHKIAKAFNDTWDLPIFSWSKTSFVARPFTYISGLFGLSVNNPLNYVFAYFVSISICWLVFDLIMYVPNLAHRWLDRGALE